MDRCPLTDATIYQGRVDITTSIKLDKTVAKISG
jgi:hypothetical protein